MAYTGLYNASGQIIVQAVNGLTRTGLMSPDGCYYGVLTSENTTYKGRYHPCGAYWITVGTGIGTAIDGSMYVSVSGSNYTVNGPSSSTGPDLSGFLFYDNFSGSTASLTGRTPNKGSVWAATGTAGAGMTAGLGIMKQVAADGQAGYGYVNIGQIPRKIVGEWKMVTGDFTYPSTMAITPNTSFVPMLHGQTTSTNFLLRIVNSGPTFVMPQFWVTAANYSLSLNTKYRDELHYNGGKMAAMVKRDGNGNVLGKEVVYDPLMANYVGNYSFWETLTANINYSLSTAEATSDYVFPTIIPVAEIANPTTTNFVATIFGGSTTNSGSGIVIAAASYGQGGQYNLGAVNVNDKFWFSFDAASYTGTQMEVALLKNGAAETEKSNTVYFDSTVISAQAGRIQGTLTATETMAGASLAIACSPAGVAAGVTASNVLIIKNPITTP